MIIVAASLAISAAPFRTKCSRGASLIALEAEQRFLCDQEKDQNNKDDLYIITIIKVDTCTLTYLCAKHATPYWL